MLSVVSLVVSFLNRVVFLHILDATYLGVSGLFSNILLIFSLVELGLGAALTQMFYKPFAEKDYDQLSKVTHTTRMLLNLVGGIIIVLTIVFTPCLHFFVNDMNAVPNMRLIFFLYGLSSGTTYFLGFYRTIITANQQAYKIVKIDMVWKIVTLVMQSLVLMLTRNFISYLITQIVLNIGLNIVIKKYVQKQIPEIDYRCRNFVSKKEMQGLLKNVAGLSLNRLATVVTNGTDNILISKYLDLITVGFASNYVMIQQAVNMLIEAVFTPLLASIGNLCVSASSEKIYEYFKRFTFAAFWMFGFCSISAFALADIFVRLAFGDEYVIARAAVFFLFFDLFCIGLYRVASLFRTAQGLFWHGKFRPLLQALLNLVISLILVNITHELWTVYAGTVLSRVLISIWYEPYIVMKHGMQKKPWQYFIRLFLYVVAYFVAAIFTVWLVEKIPFTGLIQLLVGAIICVVCINAIFLLAFSKTSELKYWFEFLKNLFCRKDNM